MHYPGFINGSYKSGNTFAGNERTVNLYPEPVETEGATNNWHLVPTPGVEVYSAQAASASSPGRALQVWDGRCFAVIGDEFIELQAGGARVVRGTVSADTEPASIVYNGSGGRQLAVSSGGGLHIYDMDTHAWTPAVTPGAARTVVMLDGYFFILDRSTSSVYQSDLLAGLTWNGANIARRIIQGDPWIQAHVHGKELWLMGEQTSEVWYNAGTFPFVLAAHPSGTVSYGIAAPWSVVSVGDALVWLGRKKGGQGEVVMASGFQPRVVSDFAIQTEIATYARIDDAVAWTYNENGHDFYLINFPTANKTWVLDLSTMKWHERGTWISEQNQFHQWRPLFHASFDNKALCTNAVGGEILTLTTGGLDVDSRPIRRIRQAPYVTNELRRIYFSSFKLHLKTGIGAANGQGSDPLIELWVSDDGENWYSEGMESAGAVGVFDAHPEWTRLGSAYNRIFRIEMSDPVPWRIVNAYLEAR